MSDPDLTAELAVLDATLAGAGLVIWIGAEPTFTRADSLDPPWLVTAEGGDKEERARALLVELAPRLSPAAALCRTLGRHYPDEPTPRFAYGAAFSYMGGCEPSPPPHRAEPDGATSDPSTTITLPTSPLDADPIPAPLPSPDLAWMTVTPDPAVVEVNLPPARDLVAFAGYVRATHDAARAVGLSPLRYRWNGDATDSGGGGQITFGGATAESSPFFQHPRLLPGLIAYLNAHPALSFAFAPECVGSASQGPRPDEGDPQRFVELGITLARLAAVPATDPSELWANLAPLLVDGSGNSHRAELNIEKLWNPHIPGRGKLGLVEVRSLKMEPTPDRMIAVAALFRTVCARLALHPFVAPLVDWGTTLHDRYGLPYFLAEDLRAVLDDLAGHGLVLGPALRALLLEPPAPILDLVDPGDETARLVLTPAREFWPLVGDVASQERRGARVVDASTARLEVRTTTADAVSAQGRPVPLQPISGGRVGAVRWRTFVPAPGFHPTLAAQDPLVLTWRGQSVALHGWRPGGGAYAGLPLDADEAARRRAERVAVTASTAETGPPAPPSRSYTLDLRLPERPSS